MAHTFKLEGLKLNSDGEYVRIKVAVDEIEGWTVEANGKAYRVSLVWYPIYRRVDGQMLQGGKPACVVHKLRKNGSVGMKLHSYHNAACDARRQLSAEAWDAIRGWTAQPARW